MPEGDRKYAVLPFQAIHPVDIAAHRLLSGAEGADHAAIMHGHDGPGLALRRIGDEGEEILRPIRYVGMGVFLIGHEDRRLADHRLGDMAVEVELRAHRHLGPDDGADAPQNIALAIVIALGGRGAMQRQHHHIDRHGLLEIGQHLVAQRLIGRADDASAGLGEGADAFHHLPAPRLGAPTEDQKLAGAVIGRLARAIAMGEEAVGEALIARGDRGEGVGLGVEASDEDFHVGNLVRCG